MTSRDQLEEHAFELHVLIEIMYNIRELSPLNATYMARLTAYFILFSVT